MTDEPTTAAGPPLPLADILCDLIVDAWNDETPSAALSMVPDLMARIESERAEARREGAAEVLAAVERAVYGLPTLTAHPLLDATGHLTVVHHISRDGILAAIEEVKAQ